MQPEKSETCDDPHLRARNFLIIVLGMTRKGPEKIMAWGTSGKSEWRCPECRQDGHSEYVEWFYDPTEGRVTSGAQVAEKEIRHLPDCPYADVTEAVLP